MIFKGLIAVHSRATISRAKSSSSSYSSSSSSSGRDMNSGNNKSGSIEKGGKATRAATGPSPGHGQSRVEGPEKGRKDSEEDSEEMTFDQELAQLNLFQRYKKLGTEYWYVLVPVHFLASLVLFGTFYVTSKSGVVDSVVIPVLSGLGVPDSITQVLEEGVDITPWLETLHFPQSVIDYLRSVDKHTIKNVAVSLALYKILTPVRYMVTVGFTVPSIKFLVRRELIKPVPSRARIKAMINQRIPLKKQQ
jgi:hypothetical protein